MNSNMDHDDSNKFDFKWTSPVFAALWRPQCAEGANEKRHGQRQSHYALFLLQGRGQQCNKMYWKKITKTLIRVFEYMNCLTKSNVTVLRIRMPLPPPWCHWLLHIPTNQHWWSRQGTDMLSSGSPWGIPISSRQSVEWWYHLIRHVQFIAIQWLGPFGQ